jgi:hypothetical protein
MRHNAALENKKIRGRIREILILCAFILIATVLSALIMDVLIYPLAVFAIKNKIVFNLIVKNAFWIIALSAVLMVVARRVYDLKRDGHGTLSILRHLGLRSAAAFGSVILVAAVTFGVIALIYLFLNYNYYLLYKLTNL